MLYVRDIDRWTAPHAVSYSTIYKATIYDMPRRFRSTAKSVAGQCASMDMTRTPALTDAGSMQHDIKHAL